MWELKNTVLIYKSPQFKWHSKIILFDFDWNLVKPKGKRTIPKDKNDWQLWDSCIKKVLQKYKKANYSFVIMSNQNLRMKDKQNIIKYRTEQFIKTVDCDFLVFFAMQKNVFRKPHTGLWPVLCAMYKNANQPLPIKSNCVYIGDAAGRNSQYGMKKDHSDSDRAFAYNLGIAFAVPESFFLKHGKSKLRKMQWTSSIIAPELRSELIAKNNQLAEKNPKVLYALSKLPVSDVYVIIMIGMPCSGKSTYAQSLEKKWNESPIGDSNKIFHVSRDVLKYKSRYLSTIKKKLATSISVIVDATNPDEKSRSEIEQIAKSYRASILYIHMGTDIKLARLLNHIRVQVGINDMSQLIPDVAYRIFNGKFKLPDPPKKYITVYNKITPNAYMRFRY